MPQRHKDTKIHQVQMFNKLTLVQRGALEPWWQKNNFLEWIQPLTVTITRL